MRPDETFDTRLRDLVDRDAIRDLVNLYAHNVWRNDIEAIGALFADDAEMDTMTRPTIRGKAELLEAFAEMLDVDEFRPFVHGHVIDLDGDTATGTCYLDLRAVVDGKRLMGWGWYDDRYVRVDGEWRFKYRKVTMAKFVGMGRGQEAAAGEVAEGASRDD
ncbi:MAG: nuclear transport factor 2 family protein [Acidimicrobiia bacterium]|nr:nuclear transport factor 2 family protein [Acidimicrobiia bacterium]